MSEQKITKNTVSKNKRLGLFLVIAPFVGLGLVLAIYAISTFAITSIIDANPAVSVSVDTQTIETIGALISVGLSLLGVVFIIWMFVGIPIGMYFLFRKDISLVNGSVMKKTDEIPVEINRWNWGAFFLGWIWGLANGVWISLLTFIPIINIFVAFYLGRKGNELAWRNGDWESVESFHVSQRRWAAAGTILFFISVFFGFVSGALQELDKSSVAVSTSNTYQSVPEASTKKESAWYRFNSPEHSFFALFPTQPTRSDDSSYDESLDNNIQTTEYLSELNGSSYFIFVYSYDDEQMSDVNPDFKVHDVLESVLNGMVNQKEDYELISQSVTSVDGKDAIKFVMGGDGEILNGLMTYNGQRLYLIMADYYQENPISSSDVTKFLSSFRFIL